MLRTAEVADRPVASLHEESTGLCRCATPPAVRFVEPLLGALLITENQSVFVVRTRRWPRTVTLDEDAFPAAPALSIDLLHRCLSPYTKTRAIMTRVYRLVKYAWLELFYFLKVLIREVEDYKPKDNASDSGVEMAATKEEYIDLVKNVPDSPPHEYDASNNTEVLGEVLRGKFVLHIASV